MKVYENCRLYGPYKSKKDNRLRIQVIFSDGRRTYMSYPKYLMEVHLGRYLEKDETVHHIDGNPLNNDISNLTVIDRAEHANNDAIRNKNITVICQYCGKEFTIPGSKVRGRNRADRHQSGYFCSRECTGKYGNAVQHGKIKPTTVDRVVPEKYKRSDKSAQGENPDVEAG